jgi:hypothetical protein
VAAGRITGELILLLSIFNSKFVIPNFALFYYDGDTAFSFPFTSNCGTFETRGAFVTKPAVDFRAVAEFKLLLPLFLMYSSK